MAQTAHRYEVALRWTGNTGTGTSGFRDYRRTHDLSGAGKPDIAGSSDTSFRGNADRWNPEELLVAALSACHQLAYLHLCASAGVVVTAYEDRAAGVMNLSADGTGQFERVVLRPLVTITRGSDAQRAQTLHDEAAKNCFIARSINFAVTHEPVVTVCE